jgi:hypothetical protein
MQRASGRSSFTIMSRAGTARGMSRQRVNLSLPAGAFVRRHAEIGTSDPTGGSNLWFLLPLPRRSTVRAAHPVMLRALVSTTDRSAMAMASIPTPERADARARALTTRQAFLRVFPGVMVAMFLAAADQTILASALPTIASSLSGFADISWVVVSYLLAATIAAPLYGHLGDRFGRKRMLLGALAIFSVASLGCAFAPTLLTLIVARAVQGLGGGGLMTLAQALIGEHVSPRERGRFSGYFATVFALASTSARCRALPPSMSWRAVFWINIPLGITPQCSPGRIPIRRRREDGSSPMSSARCCSSCNACTVVWLSSGGHRYAWALGRC